MSQGEFRAGAFARPTFKSLISRIVFMHIVAVAVVAIFLPLVLFWLLNSEVDQLHRERLCEIIVGAAAQSLDAVLQAAARGQHQDR